MRWVLRSFVCGVTALALGACVAPDLVRPPSVRDLPIRAEPAPPNFSAQTSVLTGFHSYNWEGGHGVLALGLSGPVCLQPLEGVALSQPQTESDPGYVEVLGRISAPGHYGHLGGCVYLFEVSRVVQDRPLTPAESELFASLLKTFDYVQNADGLLGAASDQIVSDD